MIHNTGQLECESLRMEDDKDFVIPEREVVSIDAFIYRLPFCTFRIDGALVVRAEGVERLTKINNEFFPVYFV